MQLDIGFDEKWPGVDCCWKEIFLMEEIYFSEITNFTVMNLSAFLLRLRGKK